jgi:hypothetical protein
LKPRINFKKTERNSIDWFSKKKLYILLKQSRNP